MLDKQLISYMEVDSHHIDVAVLLPDVVGAAVSLFNEPVSLETDDKSMFTEFF